MLGSGAKANWTRFIFSKDGVSAVEFSLIAPVIISMFMASIELPRAYTIGKKLNNAAIAMADLISQVEYSDMSPVFAVAPAIANPYDVKQAKIVLTAAGIYQNGNVMTTQVCSSVQSNDRAHPVGSSLGPPPKGMATKGDRFVMAEISMTYQPIFPIVSTVAKWNFSYTKTWPIRDGRIYNGQPEIILPGGGACPL